MPIHDWTKVKAGTFHNFHYRWVAAIMDALNAGLLPEGYFAMAAQIVGRPEGDVVALERANGHPKRSNGVFAVAPPKPVARFVLPIEQERYADKANRIAVHHELGDVVAVIESSRRGTRAATTRFGHSAKRLRS